jgi:hypothetical protein
MPEGRLPQAFRSGRVRTNDMGEIDINKTNLLVSSISSLATFLTMFFVLLTLFEMAKQRKSSYRPDIVVLPSQYFFYSKATHDRIQSMYISDKELGDNISNHKPLDHITLEGFNIGLGTAKFICNPPHFRSGH